MSADEHKAVVQRLYVELNQRNWDVVDELLASNYLGHFVGVPAPMSRDTFKQFVSGDTFPDFHHALEDVIVEGDRVVVRITYQGTHLASFMGMPPTGKQVTFSGINILRLADGKIVEHWSVSDMLGMLQQLGVIPAAG